MKKLCIAGKNDIAVNVLKYCLDKYRGTYEIVCVYNSTENGKNSWQRSLKWFCEKNGINNCLLEDVYDEPELIFLSLEFDKIVNPLKFKSQKLYNIHFSLLPQYKGMYTSIMPIMFDEAMTGVTLHKIDKGIDTGDIIEQEKIPIDYDDASIDIYRKLIEAGSRLVIKNLDNLLTENFIAVAQENRKSSYYYKGYIDFSNLRLINRQTAYQMHNQVRAFAFRPYQFLTYNNENIIECVILNEKSHDKAGTLLEENDVYFKIATIDYNVILYKDVLSELLDSIKNNDNERAKRFCESKKIINDKDEHGWSPLMVASYNGNYEMFNFLIEKGADVSAVNNNGTNMLMYAKDGYKRTNDERLFLKLIELGVDIHRKDYYGKALEDYCKEENIKSIGNVKF